jgi:type I restriction enzyme S subunit
MGSEWAEVQLQDIVTILGDGLHGTPKYDEDGDYYFINGNNLENGRIVFRDTTKRVSHDQFLKHRKNLNDRTILGSINGTIGNVAYYKGEKVILGKSACYFNLVDDVEKGFVRYVLSGAIFQNYLNQYATGTTIKNVSLKDMREFSFRLPSVEEQQAIAHVLGSLDDRIELNRRMNETLEAMAQALFKSWFVDFDPVIDNALASGKEVPEELAGRAAVRAALGDKRKPLPAEIRALFPDEFVYSDEMGWIPKGWEVKPLDSIAKYQNGLALQKFRPENEEYFLPVVKIAQLRAGKATVEEKASPNIDPACIIDNGDVIFSWSGSLMVDVWCGGEAALNQHLFKVTSFKYPKWFYY